MVGKNVRNFPTIGKIFRRFSNDWKKFSGCFGETKGTKGATKQGVNKNRQTITTILDNCFTMKTASRTLKGGWGAGGWRMVRWWSSLKKETVHHWWESRHRRRLSRRARSCPQANCFCLPTRGIRKGKCQCLRAMAGGAKGERAAEGHRGGTRHGRRCRVLREAWARGPIPRHGGELSVFLRPHRLLRLRR